MKYTVILTPQAEAELTELWLAANNRSDLSSSADAIDRLLKNEPDRIGTLLFDTVRRFQLAPLVVDFEIIEDDRLVNVLRFQTIDDSDDFEM